MNNNNLYHELRKIHPTFEYVSYSIEENEKNIIVSYHFKCGAHDYFPSIEIEKNFEIAIPLDSEVIDKAVFNLGLAELPSYWKATCSPTVVINQGYLDEKQIKWWQKLYWNGLGEFYYLNNISDSKENFLNIINKSKEEKYLIPKIEGSGRIVPVGGGKDSAVSLELISNMKEETKCLAINVRGAIKGCIEASGSSLDESIIINRKIDQELLKMNFDGYLNGHTPFSAVIAFVSLLSALLSGKRDIVLSNEASANEGNIEGSYVNHQYSKSYEFEKDFNYYISKYIVKGKRYFSLLRPWYEIRIASEFAKHKKYFSVFKSCNAGSKEDIWCCDCAKCLFTYIILLPFIDKEELDEIFGSSLLDKDELEEIFDSLTGDIEVKPFECVGTRKEVLLALQMTSDKLVAKKIKLPKMLKEYLEYEGRIITKENLLKSFNKQNFVPKEYLKLLEG